MSAKQPVRNSGIFDQKVSRYLCYPSVEHFVPEVGGAQHEAWLRAIPSGGRIGVYIHVPFCEKLCWFCSCRTQAVRSPKIVADYVGSLLREIRRIAELLPAGVEIGRIHWGGGSPLILSPEDMARLGRTTRSSLAVAADAEFTVEIDARRVVPETIEALIGQGMTRSTLFVQDFDPRVQRAIGRLQSLDDTGRAVRLLRKGGVGSIGIDMLYGLPLQGCVQVLETANAILSVEPDRVALFGYAHVPWMAKRQNMINEAQLPGTEERLTQYGIAAEYFVRAGYDPVGIDHFVKPEDAMARAAREGRLRRRHLAYTDDSLDAVIGIGASAISSFRQGFLQNERQTVAYSARIGAERLAIQRGWAFSLEDKVRGRAIEMLMCGFRVDLAALRREFGDFASILDAGLATARERFGEAVALEGETFRIVRDGPILARLIARCLDARNAAEGRYSGAI